MKIRILTPFETTDGYPVGGFGEPTWCTEVHSEIVQGPEVPDSLFRTNPMFEPGSTQPYKSKNPSYVLVIPCIGVPNGDKDE